MRPSRSKSQSLYLFRSCLVKTVGLSGGVGAGAATSTRNPSPCKKELTSGLETEELLSAGLGLTVAKVARS